MNDSGIYLGSYYKGSLESAFGPEVRIYVEDRRSPESFEIVQKEVDNAHILANASGKNHLIVIRRCQFEGFHAKSVPYETHASFMGMGLPKNVSFLIEYCQMVG